MYGRSPISAPENMKKEGSDKGGTNIRMMDPAVENLAIPVRSQPSMADAQPSSSPRSGLPSPSLEGRCPHSTPLFWIMEPILHPCSTRMDWRMYLESPLSMSYPPDCILDRALFPESSRILLLDATPQGSLQVTPPEGRSSYHLRGT